jgi:hypothetical protein
MCFFIVLQTFKLIHQICCDAGRLRIIKKGLVRKGLVIGIIVLFIGASVVPLGGGLMQPLEKF